MEVTSEQLDRFKDKDGKTLGERLDIIELAVTGKNMTDIAHLKSVK